MKPLVVRTPRPRLPDDKHAEARPISLRPTEEETRRRPGEEVSAGDRISCERGCTTHCAGGRRAQGLVAPQAEGRGTVSRQLG